ncbi:MAG TPA: hypothetical protein PKC07_09515, partial [Agitococcus sp.]|nr:hypothetical protein [Agitococcus sp.]
GWVEERNPSYLIDKSWVSYVNHTLQQAYMQRSEIRVNKKQNTICINIAIFTILVPYTVQVWGSL